MQVVLPSARYEYAQHQGYALELRFDPSALQLASSQASGRAAGRMAGAGSVGASANVMLRLASADERLLLLALIVLLLK